MSRLLFIAAIAVVVYLLLKSLRHRHSEVKPSAKPEDMVRCAHCGVHLPKSEGLLSEGNYYCSDDHRRRHSRLPDAD